MRTAQLLLFACAVMTAEGNSLAREHEIKLNRPEKVGNNYRVSLRGTTTVHMVPVKGKQPLPPHYLKLALAKPSIVCSIELDATVKILKVDTAGHVLKKALTVECWKVEEGDDEFELDLTGKVIIAETVKGATQLKIDATRIKEYESDILRIVVATYTGGGFQDANFGSQQRRKVRETWPVKIDDALVTGLLTGLSPDRFRLNAKKLAGTVQLVSVECNAGSECLRVDVTIRGSDCLDGPLRRDGMLITKTEVESSFTGQYPMDRKGRCAHSIESRRWTIVSRNLEGVSIKQSVEESVDRKIVTNLKN
jgi:hypothetical protein